MSKSNDETVRKFRAAVDAFELARRECERLPTAPAPHDARIASLEGRVAACEMLNFTLLKVATETLIAVATVAETAENKMLEEAWELLARHLSPEG